MVANIFLIVSACASAIATIVIALATVKQWRVSEGVRALTEILTKETQRYATASEEQLKVLKEQWSEATKPWLFFDAETEGKKFILHCVNAGTPTLYLSQAKLHAIRSNQVGFSLIHRIEVPLRSGEHYKFDLGPTIEENIKRSLSIGKGYVEPPEGLVYGASCRMIVEYYDGSTLRHVLRHFPLQVQGGIWKTDMPGPQF